MLNLIERYKQTYGDRILAGGTEWDVEGLIRLAGWRGGVPRSVLDRLRLAATSDGPLEPPQSPPQHLGGPEATRVRADSGLE